MKWDVIRLGEVINVKHGFAFKSEFFTGEGDYILLTPGNCNESGGLKLKGDKEKYYVGDIPKEFLLHEGDMLVVMTDLINRAPILGGSFMIPESDRFLHNQRLGLVQITDEHRIDKSFLYYLLNTHEYRSQVRGSASGATVRHTSPNRIKACKVRIPRDVIYQHQIADILTAYDSLIENNQRRMAVLEAAARTLYREWFVRFRFPGYEHVRTIDGIPEGWEHKKIGDEVTLNYGKALKAEIRVDGPCPVFGSSGIIGRHEEALVQGPGIVLGRKGNIGSVFWSNRDFYPIDTVYYIDSATSNLYLYYALMHTHFISTDVAVPGLNRDLAYSCPLLIPSKSIYRQFLATADPIHQQLTVLEEMNTKLGVARDLLLPKLMSGEITV